ncbi:hypothetical protein JAAARDRAFT_168358 [Jaapia argillacea MUCL 33604]|uniref:VASt domain-containing protein n=1 Tax=Jaapia argillacea MUCL 33604 TaxID=933084 RepID=A0A067QK55_9AGAM|nr:hypothetical protein JAAARDRAFT_168358 [Jaapia argillacea MUCL 33604]
MAPSFLSKFVKASPDRRSTELPRPDSSSTSLNNPGHSRSQSVTSDSSFFSPGDVHGDDDGHPNVTVIPPSPGSIDRRDTFHLSAGQSQPQSYSGAATPQAHQRFMTDTTGSVRRSDPHSMTDRRAASISVQPSSSSSRPGMPSSNSQSSIMSDDALPTPTPGTIKAASSTGNLRAFVNQANATASSNSHLISPSSSSSSNNNSRSSPKPGNIAIPPSSTRGTVVSSDSGGSFIAGLGLTRGGGEEEEGVAGETLVDSPTSLGHENTVTPSTSSNNTFDPNLLSPHKKKEGDAISILSVSTSGGKTKGWRRSSNPTSPKSAKEQQKEKEKEEKREKALQEKKEKEREKERKRKPTGLASALAASGLAMANPGTPMSAPLSMPPSASSFSNNSTNSTNNRRPTMANRSNSSTSLLTTGTNGKKKKDKSKTLGPPTSGGGRKASGNGSKKGRDRAKSTTSDPSSARGRKSTEGPNGNGTDDGLSDSSSGGRSSLRLSDLPDGDRSSDEYTDSESGEGSEESEEDESDDDDLLLGEEIPVTGFAVASNKRNADFHELFGSIPEGDYLIEDYGCALQREILIQGRLYISENHICFHANIFGWITDLIIPTYEITSLEKKMTAFVIPNAIQITTRTAKYTFASFLSRDTTFDVIFNIWRLARPDPGSRLASGRPSLEGSVRSGAGSKEKVVVEKGDVKANGEKGKEAGEAAVGVKRRKATQCACGKEGKHFSETAMDVVLPGTPEKIYNLMFASGFIKEFMIGEQKLIDLQISDWTPIPDSPACLARNMSYIKPLYATLGPKQTKCELRDETVHCDFDDYVVTLTTTRTPDVPSGNVFSVKTRTCLTWASAVSTRVLVTSQVEWTGRSFIRGIIEKSCLDGQRTYHADLDRAMRVYIAEHQSEFIPQGVDAVAAVAEAEEEVLKAIESPTSPISTPPIPLSEAEARKEREHERNQRSLQWALDTFEGAYNVGKQSATVALELVTDAWDQSSTTTILYFVIAGLVISNIWTLVMVGNREEVGRRKEAKRMEEKEKWIQGVVTTLWEELAAQRNPAGFPVPPVPVLNGIGGRGIGGDWKDELGEIYRALDAVELRVKNLRESLKDLD